MKIFLTGGTGFIGSYVVNELVNEGHRVTILARNPEKVSGFLANDSIEFIQGNLSDRDIIKEGLTGKDACVHIALGWGDTAVEMLASDTAPSVFIFETAAQLGVDKLIYTSSTATVGEFRPQMDEKIDTLPVDFYGATKAASEAYLLAVSEVCDIKGNILRPGYTFGNPVVEGADMQPDRRFFNIIKKAKNNQDIELVKNDGTQFIWAGDLARIYTAILKSSLNRKIFFGLSREFVTWEEIARWTVEYLDSSSEIILEESGQEKEECLFDLKAIEQDFGFEFNCREKIKDHISYIADNI
ncbi:MAG: NAD-dependent epimerase/dehydratase family protein [Bacillota bacterium]